MANIILVVDDDADIRAAIHDSLADKGYTVLEAENGKRGVALAKEKRPDLVILDVGLPDMDGFEVCKRLRAAPEVRHTPVIMLTARTLEKDELRGFDAGADDYLAKPFKRARLLARVESAIVRNRRGLDANALTHLPGNQAILDGIKAAIDSGRPFSVLYFDLNNFKAFNDHYGFIRGDEAIKKTADILTRSFAASGFEKPFLGHVGGDDFVGIVAGTDVEPLCKAILKEFTETIRALYDDQDRARGFITSVDRKGKPAQVPLMGLAIAVVTNRAKTFRHPGEVSVVAGDLKKWAKSENRSAYVIDRRN